MGGLWKVESGNCRRACNFVAWLRFRLTFHQVSQNDEGIVLWGGK